MDNDKKIKFKYIFPTDYNPTYCNGAFGGVSTHGEIVVNFFLERMPIPNSITQQLNENGTLGAVINVDPENCDNTIIRNVSTGVVLTEETAKSIYEWLNIQLEELQRQKQIQSNSN